MSHVDFELIEDELDLEIPSIYRLFMEYVHEKGIDLAKWRIYHDTETILKGNWNLRMILEDQEPRWEYGYFDFGVNDGCGNYFFLVADDESFMIEMDGSFRPKILLNQKTADVILIMS